LGYHWVVRTCQCRRCRATVVIGHPELTLRERAKELAREGSSTLERLGGRARTKARRIEAELVREYYASDASRQPELPRRCPLCQHRATGDLPWWEPGIAARP
jgi:hypothetical protein